MSQDLNPDIANLPLAPDFILQDRYRIVRQLGRGGMGAVYEAVDQRLGITVALKETLSSEDSMRKQFEREARLLAGMQHPALPRVSDHFVEGSRAFLVMQFIGGIDLAKIIAQQPGPFPRDQVIAWADQLLDALIYLHARDRQVIHRDIKPHNLKLTANGQIALLDFGLAKAQPSDPSVTASQAFYGYTRHYAPLEQIQDQRTDPRSDIYALAATLYHLLTGIKPPDAMVRAAAVVNGGSDPLVPADQIHKAVGSAIAAILNKALAQKPEERFENANEFREALRRVGRNELSKPIVRVDVEQSIAPDCDKVHVKQMQPANAKTVRVPADLSMVLVGSARRFGPAGATAVLTILVTLTAGIIYGSQRLFPNDERLKPTSLIESVAIRDSALRKTRATDNAAAAGSTRARQSPTDSNRPAGKAGDTNLKTSQTEKRKTVQRISAPSIRFPQMSDKLQFVE